MEIKRKIILFLALAVLWLVPFTAQASSTADAGESRASLISQYGTVTPGQNFYVALDLQLLPGWHTYWKNPGDAGLASSLRWTLPEGVSAGEIIWPNPQRIEEGPLVTYGYLDRVTLPVQVSIPKDAPQGQNVTLALAADWLTCKESCIPQTAELDITFPVAAQAQVSADKNTIDALLAQRPTAVEGKSRLEKDALIIEMALEALSMEKVDNAYFFAADQGVAYGQPQIMNVNDGTLQLAVPLSQSDSSAPAVTANGVLSINSDGTTRYVELKSECHAEPEQTGNASLLIMMWFALLGGLILNLMPCVFPVLSFKALSLAKHAGLHPKHARAEGLAYTGGVILSFLLLAGSLIALRGAGDAIGWGFQMQSPAFVAALSFLMFAVGLNLSGIFELPTLFGGVGTTLAREGSLRGAFFTGVLAVLVAAPCTAPFMATALGFALAQPALIAFFVFAALGVGLALPFLLIGFFPQLVSFLPKPGAWMQRFREFLAFPMYATVIWLLWVLGRQVNADSIILVLLGLLSMAFGFWLCRKPGTLRRGIALLLILGLPTLILLPLRTLGAPMPMISAEHGEVPYSEEKLAELRAAGTPVFLDATAAWCITCQVNKRVALTTQETRNAFAQRGIVMMVADWTNADPAITKLLESFGYRGVPMYVYYPAAGEPVVLPQLLTEQTVLDAITSH